MTDRVSETDLMFDYSEKLFANREHEISLVQSKIRQAQSKTIEKPLIEFYAVKGQGKTWLLQRIFNFSQTTADANAKTVLTCLVAFDEPSGKSRVALLRTIHSELEKQSKQISSKSFEVKPNALVDYIKLLLNQFIPILIFDTTEATDDAMLEWLEEEVVFPLIQTERVIFVFGGRRRLFWQKFEVRRRADPRELVPFEEKDSIDQLTLLSANEAIGKELYQYSKGHPFINRRILHALRDEKKLVSLDENVIRDNRPHILELVKSIIDNEFLARLEKDTSALLWNVCVLRKFHTAPLRHFDDRRVRKSEGDYLDLIQQMIDAALVRWDNDKGGYIIDETVRKIMVENLKGRDLPRFIALHQRALQLYESWVTDYPENSEQYLLEIVYHQVELLKVEPQRVSLNESIDQVVKKPGFPMAILDEQIFPKMFKGDADLQRIFSDDYANLGKELLMLLEQVRASQSRK